MLSGFLRLHEHERLHGRLPDWCGATEAEDHARWCFDPGTALFLKGAFTLASTAFQAVSTLQAGKADQAAGRAAQQAALARQQSLEHQARQARQNAGQERAASQRSAAEQRRQGRFLSSKALARAAASGAGTGGNVENILGELGAEGEFRALNELFIGEERARGLELQAASLVFEGNQEARAGEVARRAGDAVRRRAGIDAFGQVLAGAAASSMSFGRKKEPITKVPTTTLSSGRGLSRYNGGSPFGFRYG